MYVRTVSQGTVERKSSVPGRIGLRLRNLRCRRGLSQRELQQKAGLMRCYISRLENGHTVPTLEILERLASALELPLYWILHVAEDPAGSGPTLDSDTEGSVQERMSPDARFLRKLKSLWRRMTDYDREMLVLVAGRMADRASNVAQNTVEDVSSEVSEPMQYLHLSIDACIVPSVSNAPIADS